MSREGPQRLAPAPTDASSATADASPPIVGPATAATVVSPPQSLHLNASERALAEKCAAHVAKMQADPNPSAHRRRLLSLRAKLLQEAASGDVPKRSAAAPVHACTSGKFIPFDELPHVGRLHEVIGVTFFAADAARLHVRAACGGPERRGLGWHPIHDTVLVSAAFILGQSDDIDATPTIPIRRAERDEQAALPASARRWKQITLAGAVAELKRPLESGAN